MSEIFNEPRKIDDQELIPEDTIATLVRETITEPLDEEIIEIATPKSKLEN